ncbi:pilus assembly protein Flp/PilA [Variovorax sp. TBS-050B]|uniref:Flp family type IVb pilin n=1 Tax=Variovorax sp. TBS-050B TaxID=2940551 RepID=UPI0024757554|nr:Flp family type IVb pilin [Variovorax sp. TBS-050B]MDH6590739.1 pilus assembly protein Flp/PilA [Variovorax sp. TBS-050B]
MKNVLQALGQSTRGFLRDEEGAQVVEYALIIAVVSIALVVALKGLTANDGSFSDFIERVNVCLTTSDCK